MDTDFLSPITLGVDPFLVGDPGGATPTASQLINPNRSAMLIDEVRFNVSENELGQEFATMQAQLTLGSTPLTNGFLPLPSFAPLYQSFYSGKTLTWHFARPMYVPPDVQVSVSFRRKAPLGFSDFDVTNPWGFSIMGRSMPAGMQVPSKIFVPWASATSCYTRDVPPFTSGDADIGNPFDEPLNVDYFTGFNYNSVTQSPSITPITVQMTLSNSKVLARDPIPFYALFPPNRPIMKQRALLQPKEFISVVLDIPQPTNADYLNFTTIGMTGWREMKTPLGALP